MNKSILVFLVISLVVSGCATPATIPPQGVLLPSTMPPPSSTPALTSTAPTILTETLLAEQFQSPTLTQSALETSTSVNIREVIDYEMEGSFDFFWEQANTDPNSSGYGLVRDRYPGSEGIASIASLGFGLTAYLIGIEKGYITYQEGYDRVNRTLKTLKSLPRVEGFYYHFVDMQTGKRAWTSEVSTIDTAILLMGVLSVGQYFGGEIESKAKEIYDAVNWPWFLDPARNMFFMAYRPEKGFEGHWDFYAEQLILYVLAAGSDTYPIDLTPYYKFIRDARKYGNGKPFIHSWFGSIFTYQTSHAWIDFRGYTDTKGTNWFDNSVEASIAHYNFAVDMQTEYKTLGPLAWGLSASDGPDGYNGTYGALPSGYDDRANSVDDTIPPSGAICSIIFLPQQAEAAMLNYYTIDRLKGKYGFVDAYNLSKNWFATDVIGIDKGLTLLMLANYENDMVYQVVMENANIIKGLEVLRITRGP